MRNREALPQAWDLGANKARFAHGVSHFWIAHKGLPHEFVASIRRHQHGNAHVDPNHIFRKPVRVRIESVNEAVALPDPFAKMFAHIMQGPKRRAWKKRD